MTTASITSTTLIDNTWLNQDCSQRLTSIEKIEPSDQSNQSFLIQVAQKDEYEEVRCAAIFKVLHLDELEKLRTNGGKAQEACQQQICRIIAGTVDSQYSEQERIEKLGQLKPHSIKQIALITKIKSIGTVSVAAIKPDEDLADLCLFASNVQVRKLAALNIEDEKLLKDIQRKVAGKDKTVSKTISTRLESGSAQSAQASAEKISISSDDNIGKKDSVTPKAIKTDKPAPAKTAALPPVEELKSAELEAKKLSYKNTARLFELRGQLRKILTKLDDADVELKETTERLLTENTEKIEKNTSYQEKLKAETEGLLLTLKEALEAGNSETAIQCWDKIQGNISNTANLIRAELQKAAAEHKAKITELRDWKTFAATEKKKELVVQMQHLLESKMHASDRSKNISKMHKEWKELGRSNQNEQLWKEFKTVSDKAYEPCKEYFKQRKQQMAENFLKRREICDMLESEQENLNREEPDLSQLNKLLSQAEKDWKQYAPIEQSKIKSLQKRFYGIVNQLRKLRKSGASQNAKMKQELLTQAQALTTLEDNKKAMNEAKRLQQEWKIIGPTSYKEDNKYWLEFRAACDKVFDKRNQESEEMKQGLKKIEERLNQILSALDSILSKEDTEFRESRSEFHDLAQEFSNSLDPRIKSQRARLLDQFNLLKRQLDSRYRALPDKKQQQIQNTIIKKSDMLRSLEIALMQEKDPEKFKSLQNSFDIADWDSVGDSGKNDLDAALATRLKTVISVKNNTEMLKLSENCEGEFRKLCIEAEIRANADSPAQDKGLRMKLQLQQLQSGFGQAKPDPKQNIKYALEAEFRSSVLGPLQDPIRKSLTDRLAVILTKLR